MGKTETITTLKTICGVVLLMALIGTAMYLYESTIVELWLLLLCSAAGAIMLWIPLKYIWERILSDAHLALCFTVHLFFFTFVVGCGLLGLNRIGAKTSEVTEIKTEVINKYEQTRHHSQRVGRGRYVKGRQYNTYHVEIQLPDGRHKTLSLSRQQYYRVASNQPYPITVANGLFGWPIILQ